MSGHSTLGASVLAESREEANERPLGGLAASAADAARASASAVSASSASAGSGGATLAKGEGGGGARFLVVGAGLSGAVVAREAAEAGIKVLVIDKRSHTGGNCFDYIDAETGFRMALYGARRDERAETRRRPRSRASARADCVAAPTRPPPSRPSAGPHFFHTNSERVWSFVNRFSEWTPWEHRVVARVGEAHVPVPVNITTVNTLFDAGIADEAGMDAWLAREQVPCAAPRDSRDVALSRVGSRLYELLFRGYTRKQWDKWPEQLEASVLARIPVRNNRDDRYFTDRWQALPRRGYAAALAAMLDHANIEVRTGVDFFAERDALRGFERTFYTGPIDRYFAHLGHDPLEYRTVTFDRSVVPTDGGEARVQPTSQVNYPSPDIAHTRITEYKHLPNQDTPSGLLHTPRSVLMTEFSTGSGEPFYPVPAPANRALYEKYRAAAAAETGVVFVGRLASYKYFNMDQAIDNALSSVTPNPSPLSASMTPLFSSTFTRPHFFPLSLLPFADAPITTFTERARRGRPPAPREAHGFQKDADTMPRKDSSYYPRAHSPIL